MAFSNPVTGGQGALVRPAIKSPDYAPGVSGWSINRDGSAEFNGLVVRGIFNGTTYTADANGIFVYAGAPRSGNLIASIAPAAGNDAFGNAYFPGVVSYDIGSTFTFTQLLGGALNFGFIADAPDAGNMTPGLTGITNSVTLQSPMSNIGSVDPAWLTLVSGIIGATTGQVGAPYLQLLDLHSSSAVDMTISGTLIKSGTGGVRETWQTPAYNANWSGSTTFNGSTNWNTFQFRRDAQDNLMIGGAFKAGTTAPGVAVFQLPVGFRPKSQFGLFCERVIPGSPGTLSNGVLGVSTAGNVNIMTATGLSVTASNEFVVPMQIVPLGNIS